MPSLVLIPGLLCDRRLWHDQIEALGANYEVLVADITQDSTLSEMTASVLTQAPERFSLAGFSLGSQVALEIMRVAKHRVERLALLSTTHGGLLPEVELATRRAVAMIEEEGLDQYLEAAFPPYVAPARANDKSLKSIFVEMGRAVGKDAGLRQMQALLAIKTPFENLNQVQCPTVIVGGSEDRRTTPAAHQLLHQEIPGSELQMIDDAGHFTPIEQPQRVIDVLQHWLAL
ncbi:MAG: alpha/beta hydrolase [Candidatus Acidiferrum sp.]